MFWGFSSVARCSRSSPLPPSLLMSCVGEGNFPAVASQSDVCKSACWAGELASSDIQWSQFSELQHLCRSVMDLTLSGSDLCNTNTSIQSTLAKIFIINIEQFKNHWIYDAINLFWCLINTDNIMIATTWEKNVSDQCFSMCCQWCKELFHRHLAGVS